MWIFNEVLLSLQGGIAAVNVEVRHNRFTKVVGSDVELDR